MKLKDLFLGLCIAALLVSEVFLFLANQQKSASRVQMNAAQHEAAQAQSDLGDYKKAADAQADENVRLRAENQSLKRKVADLQNQLTQLSGASRQLSQQLSAYQQTAEQQQEQLQQLQYANQQAQAQAQQQIQPQAAAQNAAFNTCMNNLRLIDAAKQQWALENNKTATDVPAPQDLLPYLVNNSFPVCPSGGIYTINAVGVSPSCSIHGTFSAP